MNETQRENNELHPQEDNNQDNLKYKNKFEVFKGGILGFFIGLAVIVPGVSGSAVAIIFKLYEKLLFALSNLFKQFKRCLLFLLPIALGLIVGFVLGFFGIRELLNILPFATVSLFAGLMVGAFPSLKDQIKNERKTSLNILFLIIGLLIPIVVSLISIFVLSGDRSLENLSFVHYIMFLGIGFLVSITQLVPGLSATALLMGIGYFTPLMNSVSLTYWKANPYVLLVYLMLIVGFIIGLLTVSKILSILINKFHGQTFFTICGLSLGSIITMFLNSEVFIVYKDWNQNKIDYVDLILGIVLFFVGIVLAYIFVRYERKKDKLALENNLNDK